MMPLSICMRTIGGIDHRAAIDGAGHALDLQRLAIGHGDLGDLRHDRAERGAQRDAAARSRRQRLAPARFLGRRLQHLADGAACRQQLAAELERVLLQGQRQLVDEALVEEGGVRMADRAPEADRHRAVGDHGLEPVERKGVGRILDGIALGLALRRQADRRAPETGRLGDCATWRLATLASLGAACDASSSARQRASAIGR